MDNQVCCYDSESCTRYLSSPDNIQEYKEKIINENMYVDTYIVVKWFGALIYISAQKGR